MSKYWENEEPIVVETEQNVFSLFEASGRLQVSRPSWLDKNGNEARGKTVTINLEALRGSPEAIELFRQAIGL